MVKNLSGKTNYYDTTIKCLISFLIGSVCSTWSLTPCSPSSSTRSSNNRLGQFGRDLHTRHNPTQIRNKSHQKSRTFPSFPASKSVQCCDGSGPVRINRRARVGRLNLETAYSSTHSRSSHSSRSGSSVASFGICFWIHHAWCNNFFHLGKLELFGRGLLFVHYPDHDWVWRFCSWRCSP